MPDSTDDLNIAAANLSALLAELTDLNGGAPVLIANILRNWSRAKINTVATYLLGNESGSQEVYGTVTYLEPVETNKVQLDVVECSCGYHAGLDATYLDQVGDFQFICPACNALLTTEYLFE